MIVCSFHFHKEQFNLQNIRCHTLISIHIRILFPNEDLSYTGRPVQQYARSGGGVLTFIYMVYVYVSAFLGCYFAKFGIAIGGFSSEMKEPKLHKLGVF